MSLTSSVSASEQWMKNLGVLKKPGPGETPNSQRWFNTMLTYLESKNLAWVVETENMQEAGEGRMWRRRGQEGSLGPAMDES